MKKTIAFTAVAALGISSAALADSNWDTDIAIDMGSFTLSGSAGGPVNDATATYSGLLVGFSFEGDYSDPNDAGMWASDTRLNVYLDGVQVYSVGGFTAPANPWDFQGGGSAPDGFYSHGPDTNAAIKGLSGDWEFVFTNGWDSDLTDDIQWDNAILTIHTIPAPGALALLGLAGLAGTSRRRRG